MPVVLIDHAVPAASPADADADADADAVTERIPRPTTIHPVARWTLLPIASVVGLVHLVASWRPGYWFDEATTLALGRDHPSWGYADQPPLGPLLARLVDAVAPGSVVVLRLPTVLASVLAVVLAALVARELGGDRRAQTLTALAQATMAWGVFAGHWLVPYGLEPAVWLLLSWCLVRWTRTRDDRLLPVAGLVVGVAAELRFQAILLGVVVLVCVLVLGPRALLRRPLLWVGALLAVLVALPTLLWQAGHGWPQLRMGAVAAGEAQDLFGGYPGVAAGFVFLAGVLGAGLLVLGLWWSVRLAGLRDVRFLGATFVVLAVFFVVTLGRPYYLAGLYGALAAVGAIGLQRRREAPGAGRRWRWVAWPAAVLSVALAGVTVVVSEQAKGAEAGTTIAAATADAYRGLSAAERAHTAVLGQTYLHAAFVDTYGRAMGLPPAFSTNRAYGYLPAPSEQQDQVLYVGSSPDELRPYFPDVRLVSDTGKDSRVWLARGRVQPWSAIWPRMRHLDV